MLTDAEAEALARDVLIKAIAEIQKMAPHLIQIVKSDTNEPCIEFSGTSKEGHGSFRFLYLPLQPIKQLVLESGNLFDNFVITLTDKQARRPQRLLQSTSLTIETKPSGS